MGQGRVLRVALLPVVVGVLVFSLVLRGPLVEFAPVAAAVRHDLGIEAGGLGLLTALPVLCFGLAVPLAVAAIRRFGAERSVVGAASLIAAATLVRPFGGFGLALVMTVLIGIGITVGNVVVPVLIRRDVAEPDRSLATGLFAAVMNTATMVVTIATAPLAALLGWRVATAAWSVLGVIAALTWLVLLRRSRRAVQASGEPALPPVEEGGGHGLGDPLVLLLSLTFAGQAFSYYALTSWLPTLLHDEQGLGPEAAGAVASIFQVLAVVGALGVPVLLARSGPRRAITVVGALWVATPLGLLVAPAAYPLWAALGGIAQGGGFVAVLSVIVRIARGPRDATALAGVVQGAGYVVAAAAPPVVGLVHQATGTWSAALGVVLVSTAVFAVAGAVAAARAGTVRPAR